MSAVVAGSLIEVHAREATPAETHRSARALLKLARDNGWRGSATYARGPNPARRGAKEDEPRVIVDSVVVRVSLDTAGFARAYAVFTDGRFDVAFRYSQWITIERVGYREVRDWITLVTQLADTT